jgi:hypothetical protein
MGVLLLIFLIILYCFRSDCTILRSHQQCIRVPVSPHHHLHSIFSGFVFVMMASFLMFFFFIIFTFAHICIHCLDHLHHLHPTSRQNLFRPLVLWFCWRENIRDNKKDIVFFASLNKDSYTERFLHMCITTHIGSSLPDLFTTFWSPSHSGLCQFKSTIFAPLQWAQWPHSGFRFPCLSLFLSYVFSP